MSKNKLQFWIEQLTFLALLQIYAFFPSRKNLNIIGMASAVMMAVFILLRLKGVWFKSAVSPWGRKIGKTFLIAVVGCFYLASEKSRLLEIPYIINIIILIMFLAYSLTGYHYNFIKCGEHDSGKMY